MSRTKLNAFALYANFVIMGMLGLFLNPILVQELGTEKFGIWKSCLKIFDLSSAADGRATQALKWVVAHQSADGDKEKKQRIIGAALVIWLLWLPVLLTALGATIAALPYLINGFSPRDYSAAQWAASLLAANIVLTALLGIPDAVLFGTNQGYRSVVLTTIFLFASNILMVAAAKLGYGLGGLAFSVLAGSLLNGVATWLAARRWVAWWNVKLPQLSDVRFLLNFSNWTTIWSLVHLFLLSTEVIVIGYLIGPAAVTNYTFSSYLFQFALAICLTTASAVTPKIGALIGAGDWAGARLITRRTRDLVLTTIAVSGACIILLNGPFVRFWSGRSDFYLGNDANFMMVLVFAQFSIIRFDAQIQDLGLKIARRVVVGAVAALASATLGCLFYLLRPTVAALFTGLLIGRIPLNFMYPTYVDALIPGAGHEFRGIAATGVLLALAQGACSFITIGHWSEFFAMGLFATALSSVFSYYFIFSRETRRWADPMIWRLFHGRLITSPRA